MLPSVYRMTSKRIRMVGRKRAAEPEKRKHRWRPGTVALREVRRLQRSVDLVLQRLPVARVIRECAVDHDPTAKFAAKAIAIIHEALEMQMVRDMELSHLATRHRRCMTVSAIDSTLVKAIRDRIDNRV